MKQLQTTSEAIQTVKDNNETYYNLGICFAKSWVSKQMKPFTSEDLSRDMYLVLGLPDEVRVLGAIFKHLSAIGAIKHNGYVRYKAKQGHSKPCSQWVSKEYSLKQKNNRKSDKTLNMFDDL